jgi:hypothetical protein
MPIRPSFRPQLDILEERTCPSLTLHSIGPNLVIKGTPTTSLAGLTITGTGGTNFDVKDGVKDLGTFSIAGNLTLDLKHYSAPITLDLNGQALGGNVVFDVGSGDTLGVARPISIISSVAGGTIGGSVKLVGGTGDETLDIGAPGVNDAVSVIGSLTFDGRNSRTGNNNTLAIFDGSSINGNVTALLVTDVEIGESASTGAFVGGNLSVHDKGSRNDMTVAINQSSEVAGNVAVTGTSQFVAQGDSFVVETGAIIVGTTTANLGSNTNTWKLGGTFDGNVRLVGGGGAQPAGGIALNTIELDDGALNTGTFNGSVAATTSSGSTAFVFNTGSKITGKLTLHLGDGTNDLGGGNFGGVFAGTVAGNISISLGAGSNTAVLETAPGGTLSWNSGAGTSSLTLGSATTQPNSFWKVNAHFGVGTNSLTLAPAAPGHQFLSGKVTGQSGSDVLTNNGLDWAISTKFAIGKGF